jgi:hypothetical protein
VKVDVDSIALMITNIPCANFSLYPDIQEMFEDVEDLRSRFGEKQLHATIIWLTV